MAQRLGRAEAGYAARGSSLICDSRPAAPCCLGGSTTGSGAEQPLQTTAHGQLLGQSGHCSLFLYRAAVGRQAAFQPPMAANGSFSARGIRAPDPNRPDDVFIINSRFQILDLPLAPVF